MVESISLDRLRSVLEAGEVPVVFVMSESQYDREHIPGTINVPEADLASEAPDRFDPDDELVVYCASESCQASARAALKLESMGFSDVTEFEGGLAAWRDAGLPLAGSAVEAD